MYLFVLYRSVSTVQQQQLHNSMVFLFRSQMKRRLTELKVSEDDNLTGVYLHQFQDMMNNMR